MLEWIEQESNVIRNFWASFSKQFENDKKGLNSRNVSKNARLLFNSPVIRMLPYFYSIMNMNIKEIWKKIIIRSKLIFYIIFLVKKLSYLDSLLENLRSQHFAIIT